MKPYYVLIKEEIQEEEKFYAEEHKESDWKYFKEASELFLIHAYSHLLENPRNGIEIFGDANYKRKYEQFYLNLAIGLELLLKSIMLKRGMKINKLLKEKATTNLDPERTLQFRAIINQHLDKVLLKLSKTTLEEVKDTLRLVNLRRNNIAHCSKKSRDSYLHEHRVSYVTLYIYEKFFYGENSELTGLLLQSINRSN